LTLFFYSCNAVKRLGDDQLLLTANELLADGEEVKDRAALSQIAQKPNSSLLGLPIGIYIYNLADPKPDSTFQQWLHKRPKREENLIKFYSKKQVDKMGRNYIEFNEWIQKTGDQPIVIDQKKAEKSLDRLIQYYSSFGWFNPEGDFEVIPSEKKEKRGTVRYSIQRHKPYIIDSIDAEISSPVVDSLFSLSRRSSLIKKGKQFANNDFVNERERLTLQFRNSGLYYFDQDYITFKADTVDTDHKADVTYIIPDREITEGDSTRREPFKVHKVNRVRIVTDYKYENRNKTLSDSISYNGYELYAYDEINYRPKAITDAVSIEIDKIFKDIDRNLTYNQISDLGVFRYPNINYEPDPDDSTGTGLIANVLLSPMKKYTLGFNFDVIPIESPIQQFGMGGNVSMLIRNVFRGAETLEFTLRGNIGSSKDAADRESRFFDILDIGGDVRLSFPSILFPIRTEGFIKKFMSPKTTVSTGINAQKNIGLDRQNFNGVLGYSWKPTRIRTNAFDLFNLQYVRNLNSSNYYNVYRSEYDRLNNIAQDVGYEFQNDDGQLSVPDETSSFVNLFFQPDNGLDINRQQTDEVLSLEQRRRRLTENNLILSTTYTWTRDSREGILDNSFSRLQFKLEGAGNLLAAFSSAGNIKTNEDGNYKVFGVVFSQYAKFETNYIRHWEIDDNNILAFRFFGGIAIPYGNSTSIPFVRSYFAGGANDNRGWRPYDLGPGSSGSILDFNEANFKLALNVEYRFPILGSVKGAIFADAGNIWNVFDDVDIPSFRFDGLQDLSETALATGFGLRYDFGFFVLRLDTGFKTYNPALPEGARWFKQYNFANAVYNIGINYPF
jgi:outer membrane protein assembly factor BamA